MEWKQIFVVSSKASPPCFFVVVAQSIFTHSIVFPCNRIMFGMHSIMFMLKHWNIPCIWKNRGVYILKISLYSNGVKTNFCRVFPDRHTIFFLHSAIPWHSICIQNTDDMRVRLLQTATPLPFRHFHLLRWDSRPRTHGHRWRDLQGAGPHFPHCCNFLYQFKLQCNNPDYVMDYVVPAGS